MSHPMDTPLSPYIKTTVLRRARAIWFTRRVLPFLLLEAMAVAFVVRQLAASIFLNSVLQNAMVHTFTRSPIMIADFFFRAFLNTNTLVQLLVLASTLMGILLMRDTLRAFRTLTMKQGNFSRLSHVMYM